MKDLAVLWPEDLGWPQDIGVIAILDGTDLLDTTGRFRIEDVREQIARRLHLLPRFRQILYRPRFGLGRPLWVDARSFDLTKHVRVLALPAPGDEGQLLLACEELRHRRFGRSRPLWEFWFLPGLPRGRVGLFIKLHHTMADGVSGVVALGAFVDATPDATPPVSPPWTPAPVPSLPVLFRDNVRGRVRGFMSMLSGLAHPVATLRRIRSGWRALRQIMSEGRAPRTSINRRIGSHRRLAVIHSDLEPTRQIAHAHGAKVNDVLLCAIAGGLRDLLISRGEPVTDLMLRAMVPISPTEGRSDRAQNDTTTGMLVRLPVGEPEPVRRLGLIAAETAMRKRESLPWMEAGFLRSAFIQRVALRFVARQRMGNVYVANVPGPPIPLYLAGARLLQLFPVVPLMGNITLGIGALSYAGQFNLTAVADRDSCPDLAVFVEGVENSLDEMARSVAT